ncbi:MAG: hypothetical protein ACON5D_07190 [Rubripirellula sp.]
MRLIPRSTPVVMMCLRSAFSILLLLLMINLAMTNLVLGQAEIFGQKEQPTVESTSQSPLADNDPLLKQILEQAGRSHLTLASSIRSLATLDRWKEADQLLQSIPGKNLEEDKLADIFSHIGPENYLKLKQSGKLSQEGITSLDALQVAASSYSQSTDRLRKAIEDLVAGDEDTRLGSTRILLSGGDTSVQELVSACSAPQPKVKLTRMLTILDALGGGGDSALRQMALYGIPANRSHAIHALSRLDLDRFLIDIATAAHAEDSTPEERSFAEQILDAANQFPPRGETLQALQLDLKRLLAAAKQQRNDGKVIDLWSINATRDGVQVQPTASYLASFRKVYDAASRLQRLGALSADDEALVIVNILAYQVMADPDWGDSAQIEEATGRFPTLQEPQTLSGLLQIAINEENTAAAIALVRILSNANYNEDQVKTLLSGAAGTPGALAQAAVSATAQLRFEATSCLTSLADDHTYPGISQVRRTLSEMARLGDEPTAILVETRPETILAYENLLRKMGMEVKRASTVAQAQRLVDQGGDIRLILAKQQLFDRTAIELIDTVRRTHRGRKIPIVIFGDEKMTLGAPRWQAPTRFLFNPVTSVTLGNVLDEAKAQSFLPAISVIDRNRFREQAELRLQ